MKQQTISQNRILAAGLALMIFLAGIGSSGCGMAVRSASTALTVDETGKIREEIVEDKGPDNFTEEELKAFIEQETEAYNSGKDGTAVGLSSCTIQNNSVQISMEYASCADYAAFNQVTCFVGTLQEAEDAGYEVERTWKDPDGLTGDMEIIRERFKEWKVCIVSEPITVKVPDKILYASDNVRITGRLTAVVETVMGKEAADTSASPEGPAGQSGTGQEAQSAIHPLATVADRFAYIIYK